MTKEKSRKNRIVKHLKIKINFLRNRNMFEFIKKHISSPDSSKQSIKPRLDDPLKVGREIIVKRSEESGGALEGDFKITAFIDDGKTVVVQKRLPGEKVLVKEVPLRELEKLNPPRER